MARKKTIGILSAIVTADAAHLRNEFKSVDNTIRRSTTNWQKQLKGGLKLGFGIAGAQGALSLLIQEVKHVIANIESIPGIPAEAISSVQDLRSGLAQMRSEGHKNIATFVHLAAVIGKSIGAGAAMLLGADGEDVTTALSKLETPDEIALAKDQSYKEKVEDARKRLLESSKKAARASMTEAEQIAELRAEAARYDRLAESTSRNTLQRFEAQIQSSELSASAAQKLTAMKKDLAAAEEKLGAASFGAARAKTNDAQAVSFLQDKTMQLQTELAELYSLMRENGDNPEYLAAAIEKTNELTAANKQLEKVLDRQKQAAMQFGQEVAGSFEQAVFSGGKLRDMVGSLWQDIVRLGFRNAITQPLGTALGNLLSGNPVGKIGGIFSLLGFADGGRPPVGRPSIVGERGPEVFVPDASGTIVPNHQLGGSSKSTTIYADMRGASIEAVDRLFTYVRQLDASIEERAVSANVDAMRRRAVAY